MAWRLMWHPDPVERDLLVGSPVSFVCDEETDDAEARALIRQLAAEGLVCISVAAASAGETLHGSSLTRWLEQMET